MKELGFSQCYSDSGVFIHLNRRTQKVVIAVVYIDDALFTGSSPVYTREMKAKFMARWESRDLGIAEEFLRMHISYGESTTVLDQRAYLKKIAQSFDLENSKVACTPLPAKYIPIPHDGPVDPKRRSYFQQIIGSLLYLALGTRPDIAFAVIKLSQMSTNPSDQHIDDALRIVRYLVGTSEYSLTYDRKSNSGLFAYCDSDWATDPTTRRSHTGYFFSLASAATSWVSKAQKTVAHSSTEAEYIAVSDCSRQACWYMNLFSELKMPNPTPIPINSDNMGSLFNGLNPVTEGRLKHIDLKHHGIREFVQNGFIDLFYVPTNENPADMLTKNLSEDKIKEFSKHYGLSFAPQ